MVLSEKNALELEPLFMVRYFVSGLVKEPRPGGFWMDVSYVAGREKPEDGASLVEKELGAALTSRLRKALAAAGSRTGGVGFKLQVLQVRDGSLLALFGVDDFAAFSAAIGGLGSELVLELINSCAEEALQDTTGATSFGTIIQPKAILEAALKRQEQNTPTTTPATAPETRKPTWSNVLIAAQRSFWLVPLLLALAVLWVAFSGLTVQLTRLHEQEERFAKSQAATVEAGAARIKQSETLILELIAQLRKDPTPPKALVSCER